MTRARSHRDHYSRAALRGVLPVETDGAQCLSFDMAGGEVLRLVLDAGSMEFLIDAVSRYRAMAGMTSHSEGSSGSPKNDGSPQEGQNVAPDTSSSSAEAGDA